MLSVEAFVALRLLNEFMDCPAREGRLALVLAVPFEEHIVYIVFAVDHVLMT